VPAGSHSRYATARDAAGNTSPSLPVTVMVTASVAPRVTISTNPPANQVTRKSPGTITAAVTAGSDRVDRVEFLVGSTLLCTDRTAPDYTCSWVVPAAGIKTYPLHANVYDASGHAGAPNTVTITISK